jgi:hypothetical protein
MYLCVECGHSVSTLYKECSTSNLRLTACPHCHQIADKYIEWETQMVLLDLILNRPQAYRHILANRSQAFDTWRQVLKFLTVVYAFDAFDRWYLNGDGSRLDDTNPVLQSAVGVFSQWLLPHNLQWSLLLVSLAETSLYLGLIYAGARLYTRSVWGKYNYHPAALLSAIVLSCFSKLGVLLWMVWDAQRHHRIGIELFTLVSNIVAVTVFISPEEQTNFPATVIVLGAYFARKALGFYVSLIEPGIQFSIL